MEGLLQSFQELNLHYTEENHAPAFTVEELVNALSSANNSKDGLIVKNLFLKDSKKGFFLLSVEATQTVDLKKIQKKLALKKARFATKEQLTDLLKVGQGSVTPLAVMNDTEKKVTIVLDKKLTENDEGLVHVHPLQNDKTWSITQKDLLSFLKHHQHEPVIVDFSGDDEETPAATPVAKKAPKKETKAKKSNEAGSKEGMSQTKEDNFADWYTEAITKSGLIDYYDISGCYILRPWSYEMWEKVQQFLDKNFKSIGVKNCYFPMFVSKEKLMKEKDHLEGFAPEVAWVTEYGESKLQKPIAIRPTSETIMYPAFKNWIRSHRDLPMKLNQWNNVVRWEFKNPTPFIRTREFLWQEGHTIHETKEEACEEVQQILDFYKAAYEEILAVPMIQGKKTEKEKFAGADYTTTIEGFIPSTGRGIQAATSHHLGQNFGKMFDISIEGEKKGEKKIPYQNSWGFTTRSLGVMIMVHGDNKGLVLPPRVAPLQVIVIPIPYKKEAEDADKAKTEVLITKAKELEKSLLAAGVRVEVDDRGLYSPGWKYNHWELKGVPLRIELGPMDYKKNQVRVVRRDNGDKIDIPMSELNVRIPEVLEQMQKDMLDRARVERDARIRRVTKWEEFVPALSEHCMVLTPFCNETEWEEKVKDKSREESLALMGEEEEADNTATSAAAKTLCIPYKENENPMPEGMKCFISGKPATCWTLWGRSY